MSLFFGLNIAMKGMMASQASLNVTANNISNANTDGYTRQRADLVESPGLAGLIAAAQLGSGVDVADVTRIRNEFTDYQIRTQTSSLNYDTTLHDTLANVETDLNETSSDSGLSTQLESFWNAWQNVSTTPDSSPVRTTLMEAGVTLSDTLNQLSTQLTTEQANITNQISQTTDNVNNISQQIATLNGQIVKSEVSGETPNSLLDARDSLLDTLSGIGNITITKDQDTEGHYTGAVSVQLGNYTIVSGNQANNISSDSTDTSAANYVANLDVSSGSLGALEHLNGSAGTADTVQYYLDKLNTLASGIASAVNAIHTTGTDLDGDTGANFFVSSDSAGSAITAANISVNSDIQDDVSKIAAASGSTNVEGNGDIALKIADLQSTKLTSDLEIPSSTETGTTTLGAFYSNIVTELGTNVSNASSDAANQQTLVDQLTNKKESVSGVSLDEETANEVLYQHAYNASAKVISVIDEMLDTLINMKS